MFVEKIFAQGTGGVVGQIQNNLLPGVYQNPFGTGGTQGGLILFFTNILRLIFVGASIYAFFNLIVAGFSYMTAGGDAKMLGQAWARIWQTLLGLLIITGSFALAALFGYLIFGDAGFILNPKIYGPLP